MDILLFIQRELFLECSTMMKYFILSTRVSLCTSLYSNLLFKRMLLCSSAAYILCGFYSLRLFLFSDDVSDVVMMVIYHMLWLRWRIVFFSLQ
mmetsp:Transcript_17424/g.25974  ORF Transcript_17424/g.25974 Transcript_17424/m.25974 type:complete len:93 (+) Transcript_17424:2377-2655(+)